MSEISIYIYTGVRRAKRKVKEEEGVEEEEEVEKEEEEEGGKVG